MKLTIRIVAAMLATLWLRRSPVLSRISCAHTFALVRGATLCMTVCALSGQNCSPDVHLDRHAPMLPMNWAELPIWHASGTDAKQPRPKPGLTWFNEALPR